MLNIKDPSWRESRIIAKIVSRETGISTTAREIRRKGLKAVTVDENNWILGAINNTECHGLDEKTKRIAIEKMEAF